MRVYLLLQCASLLFFLLMVFLHPARTQSIHQMQGVSSASPERTAFEARTQLLSGQEECTIGASSGRATQDGRPMIWKSRDTDTFDNAVAMITSFRIPFLAVVDAGNRQSGWMNLNARGFAILNSLAYDLPDGTSGLDNGTFMALASGTCATVGEFQHLLDSTNITGRRTKANFAVMDSTGAVAIFETAGGAYWKFDATDSVTHPEGYALRTNFTTTGKGSVGIDRFNRSTALFRLFSEGDSITPKSILRYQMRDFADPSGIPYAIPYHGSINGAPYGYIPAINTICRGFTASAGVMHGILAGETANKSTFWVILGCPAAGIPIPYWNVGPPPIESTDAPKAKLNDTANAIYHRICGGPTWPAYLNSFLLRNDNGTGLLPQLFAAEDLIFASADSLLAQWRSGHCGVDTVLAAEEQYVDWALTAMSSALSMLNTVHVVSDVVTALAFQLGQNYPNPFNASTVVSFGIPCKSFVSLKVYDVVGREVATLFNGIRQPGNYEATFDGSGLASGVYFYRMQANNFVEVKKLVLLK